VTEEQEKNLKDWVIGIGVLIWLIAAVGGFCLFGYQCLHWLKAGTWPAYEGGDAFLYFGMDPNRITWVGLRKIVLWLTQLPLSAWLMIAPGIILGAVLWIVEDQLSEARERSARKHQRKV